MMLETVYTSRNTMAHARRETMMMTTFLAVEALQFKDNLIMIFAQNSSLFSSSKSKDAVARCYQVSTSSTVQKSQYLSDGRQLCPSRAQIGELRLRDFLVVVALLQRGSGFIFSGPGSHPVQSIGSGVAIVESFEALDFVPSRIFVNDGMSHVDESFPTLRS